MTEGRVRRDEKAPTVVRAEVDHHRRYVRPRFESTPLRDLVRSNTGGTGDNFGGGKHP